MVIEFLHNQLLRRPTEIVSASYVIVHVRAPLSHTKVCRVA